MTGVLTKWRNSYTEGMPCKKMGVMLPQAMEITEARRKAWDRFSLTVLRKKHLLVPLS